MMVSCEKISPVFSPLKQEKGGTVRLYPFLSKTSTILVHFAHASTDMVIDFTYNQTFLEFCEPSSQV